MSAKQMLPQLAGWGGPSTFNHFAAPWAWAMDTPFRWTKTDRIVFRRDR